MKANKKRRLAIKMQTETERSHPRKGYSVYDNNVAWQERKNKKALKVKEIENKK